MKSTSSILACWIDETQINMLFQDLFSVPLTLRGAPIDLQFLSADDAICIVSEGGDVVVCDIHTKNVRLRIASFISDYEPFSASFI